MSLQLFSTQLFSTYAYLYIGGGVSAVLPHIYAGGESICGEARYNAIKRFFKKSVKYSEKPIDSV